MFLDTGKDTLSVHDIYEEQGGMTASTPHPRAPVHFPLVENICIIYNSIPIYQKSEIKSPQSWGGHSGKEKWGKWGRG